LNRQIGVEEFKYGVTGDPIFTDVKGSRNVLLEFYNPIHISGTVQARTFKFGRNTDLEGY